MKKYFLLCIFTLVCCVVLAVPSMRLRRAVSMTDGTSAMVTLYGDEHYSFLLTDDGQVVEPVENVPHLYVRTRRTLADEVQRAGTLSQVRQLAPRHIGSQATAPLPALGSPKVPVILVNFTDSVFSVADTDEEINLYYDRYCNGTRDGKLYKGHGSYGSVRDYFIQQSDSLFQPDFVVIGPVTLSQPAGYYGKNSGGSGKDSNYSQFRNDAIRAAKTVYDDWDVFDNKGKNQVDMVFIIFAGCGEANGGDPESIWPKESTSSVTLDGIKFATSACCNEMRLSGGKPTPDGIGIMCHELSHALGLPDFYDTTSNATGFGMDLWSIMDFGCYAGNGYTPGAYTTYERDFMGWRALQELTTPGQVTLLPTELGGVGIKVVNDENPNEYYILENRQQMGWDSQLARMGHGLQVTHVDYNASRWNANNVNTDANHQRMTIIPANNRLIGTTIADNMSDIRQTWRGNLYPFVEDGIVVNDSLTALSTPAATVFSASGLMNKDLRHIQENGDDKKTVSFYYMTDINSSVVAPRNNRRSATVVDLLGRKVQNPSKGIYIIDGKVKLRINE